MNDDSLADVVIGETTEARMARRHKTVVANLLADVVEAMEAARKDGFHVEFGVSGGMERPYEVTTLAVIKRW